jgi:LEA14-like dessication related protein
VPISKENDIAPNVSLQIFSEDHEVESNDRKLVSRLIPDAGTIHAHGSETINIPITIIYDDTKPGIIIPYIIKVGLIADVFVFDKPTLPLEKEGEIPVPYKSNVDLDKVEFDSFSFEETSATLHMKLENKNDFDLGMNALEYEVWLAGVSIVNDKLSKSPKVEKNGISYIQLFVSFRPKDFGSALWDMIRGKGVGYAVKGNLDMDSPFGPMQFPFKKEGGSTHLKKKNKVEEGGKISQRLGID